MLYHPKYSFRQINYTTRKLTIQSDFTIRPKKMLYGLLGKT